MSTLAIRFASLSSEPSDYTDLPAEPVGDDWYAISGPAPELVALVTRVLWEQDVNDYSIS